MSHYGYVSEQLLNGDLLPPRRKRPSRRSRRRELRAAQQQAVETQPAARPAPVGVRRVADVPR